MPRYKYRGLPVKRRFIAAEQLEVNTAKELQAQRLEDAKKQPKKEQPKTELKKEEPKKADTKDSDKDLKTQEANPKK